MEWDFALFVGRHPMPVDVPVFEDWDFSRREGVRSPAFQSFLRLLEAEKKLSWKPEGHRHQLVVYVTGLTPALCELLRCMKELETECGVSLMHFDASTGEYWRQEMW